MAESELMRGVQIDRPLRNLIEIMHFLERVSEKIHGLLDEAEIYEVVKEEFAKSEHYNASIFVLTDDAAKLKLAVTSLSPAKIKAGEKVAEVGPYGSYSFGLDRSRFFRLVAKEGKTIEAKFIDVAAEYLPWPLAHLTTKAIGYDRRSGILTPLRRHGKIVGMLVVDSVELSEHFIPSVKSFAQHISTALELAEEHADRKRVEEALRESEEKYRSIVELAPDGIVTMSLRGIITSINSAFVRMTGFSEDEVVGKHFARLEILPPKDISQYLKLFSSVARGEILPSLELEYAHKDGTHRWGEAHAGLLEQSGEIIGVQVTFSDITERKKTENRVRESEERYRDLFENARDVIVTVDLRGKVTSVNRRVEEYGFKRDEIIGKNMLKFVPRKHWPRILRDVAKVARGNPVLGEVEIITPKGEIVAEYGSSPIRREKKVAGLQIVLRNITDRKRVEEALRESEERYRNIVELAPDGIITVNMKGVVTSCNTAVTRLTGFSKDELVGEHFSRLGFLHARDIPKYTKLLSSILSGRVTEPLEIASQAKDGTPLRADVRFGLIKEGNKTVGVQAVSRDITERKKMEEALRQSEEQARRLLEFQDKVIDTAVVWIDLLDTEGNVTLWNRAAELISGYSREEVIGHKKIWEWNYPDPKYRAECFSRAKEIMEKGNRVENYETTIRCKDGTPKTISWYTNNILDNEGKTVGSIAIGIDITERKWLEKELARERDLLHALMDNIPDTIYFKDTASRFTRINKAQAKILGVKDAEEATAKTDFDYFTQEHARDAYADEQKIVKTGQPLISKVEKIRTADGQFRWVTSTKVPIKDNDGWVAGIVGISRDITERKWMEEELRRYSEHLEELVEERTRELTEAQNRLVNAERLAAIGETAAMVGHDLRNPLQVIVNTLYLVKKTLKPQVPSGANLGGDLEMGELLRMIGEQVDYMNKIVSDLQEYARPVEPELVPVDLGQIVHDVLSVMNIPQEVQASVVIEDDLPKLMVDPTLIKRVFVNLITNALQAMPAGGRLTIKASRTGKEAHIGIQDTGVGISQDNLDRLFQPLFTTKAKGQGFGLAVCKRLIEAHGGSIIAESRFGEGSTFTVKIPFRKEAG